MTGAVMRETDSLLGSRKEWKDRRPRDWRSEKLRIHAPSCSSPPLSPHPAPFLFPPASYPFTAPFRGAHSLGIWTHTLETCTWTCETAEQSRSVRHACEVSMDTASWYTAAFSFLLTFSYRFIFIFYYCCFLILSILVLSTKQKIIQSLVFTLSVTISLMSFPSLVLFSYFDLSSSVTFTPSFSPII